MTRTGWIIAIGTLLLLTLSGFSSVGAASRGPILVSDPDKLEISTAEDGGRSVSVIFINPDAASLTVSFALTEPLTGCALQPTSSTVTLAPERQQEVKVSLVGCATTSAVAMTARSGPTVFHLAATAPAAPPPRWLVIGIWFGAALFLAFMTLLGTFLVWFGDTSDRRWNRDLLGISSSWKFEESWASNVTVAGAAFLALFSTDLFTKAVFGDAATTIGGELLLCAAIAALLVALAPLVLQALRVGRKRAVTPVGVFLAACLTLTAALGEVGSVTAIVFSTLESPAARGLLVAGAVLVAGILEWYAVTNTTQNLDLGLTKPPSASLSVSSLDRVPETDGDTYWIEASPHGSAVL